jgi:ribosomal subunit interface protein
MQLPLQVSFHEVPRSESIERHVRKRAAKLDQFFERVTSCRVAVEAPHRHRHYGKQHYRVRIDITIPGHEIAIARNPPQNEKREDLHATIDDAFDDAERRLEDASKRMMGQVKHHEASARGRVSKLFRRSGYGFIEARDGSEVYFHKNSVLNGRFAKLEIGSEVRYAEEDGDKGPQASTVAAR